MNKYNGTHIISSILKTIISLIKNFEKVYFADNTNEPIKIDKHIPDAIMIDTIARKKIQVEK